MIIEFSDEPQTTTPKVFSNSTGWESWGGKTAADLSPQAFSDLLDFCRDEGSRRGWNDAVANRVNRNDSPFHSELLNGVPYSEWVSAYSAGVEEQRLSKVDSN